MLSVLKAIFLLGYIYDELFLVILSFEVTES